MYSLQKVILVLLLSFVSLSASNIHLQCITIYSIFSPLMYKNKNYDLARKIDLVAEQHMNVLKNRYSNDVLYSLLLKENKKIIALTNNSKNKQKFNKLADECFSMDNLR